MNAELTSTTITAGLFFGALIIERFLLLPLHLHPFWIFRQLAKRLAVRVHPIEPRPRSQQRISGLMAVFLLLLLWAGVLAVFYFFAALQPVFAAIILVFSLGSQPWLMHAKLIYKARAEGQKSLARSRLQQWFVRDCSSLSPLGIEKTTAEYTTRTLLQVWVGVVFWFAVLGPIAAFIYRCCAELARAWPMFSPRYADFGAVADATFRMLNWLPHQLVAYSLRALLWLARKPRLAPAAVGMHRQDAELFSLAAAWNGTNLGGPIIYDGRKISRTRFNANTSNATKPTRVRMLLLKYLGVQLWVALLMFTVLVLRTML
ncbi:cobalamin biosynthesis protein [Aliidiomarina celeris]|uniref:cobalamin biosynthesis protein n=1 Tax=Aliidiomarina celeris TaxID=2249428 RepID=UPI000DE87F3C|nr:cobalamin biosynthesis protein [Aliidiomarina celeris]